MRRLHRQLGSLDALADCKTHLQQLQPSSSVLRLYLGGRKRWIRWHMTKNGRVECGTVSYSILQPFHEWSIPLL